MEAILIWIWNYSWVAEAACEAVALLSTAGAVILVRGRKPRVVAQPEVAPVRVDEQSTPPEHSAKPREARRPAPRANRLSGMTEGPAPQRSTVQEALKAMDRWETSYRRPSRGMAELARLAGSHTGARARGDESE